MYQMEYHQRSPISLAFQISQGKSSSAIFGRKGETERRQGLGVEFNCPYKCHIRMALFEWAEV
ncbi:hypothetical protein DSO57_1012791 [Entomophthora muscae]|uniref:Uncharacterized protein n=1 Tax=Entomophthora muscae TaxID=34485 RepID=A0ACC2UER6_9FUNG|nr:hypothetical protein DSO57_1012791 [Entomophthora muscae]